MLRTDKILQRINETLQPQSCQIADESAAHAGHAGAASGGGHFKIHIICHQFEGLNRISRHRLVYDAVGDMMHTEIHALTITALAPSELST